MGGSLLPGAVFYTLYLSNGDVEGWKRDSGGTGEGYSDLESPGRKDRNEQSPVGMAAGVCAEMRMDVYGER